MADLWLGTCFLVTGTDTPIQVCKKGTLGCTAKHVRRPAAAILADLRLEAVERCLVEWRHGSSAERLCAEDLDAELAKVKLF